MTQKSLFWVFFGNFQEICPHSFAKIIQIMKIRTVAPSLLIKMVYANRILLAVTNCYN